MSTVSVSAARTELSRLIDAVERGEEITLTRHGKPVATLVRPHGQHDPKLDKLYAGVDEIERLFHEARRRPLGSGPGLPPGRADELVAQIRADRDAR